MTNGKSARIREAVSAFGIRHLALSSIVLISTYDMGRQPFGLASPAAWLRGAGHDVHCVDLTRTRLPEDIVKSATLVAFYLPMHTATRLALAVIDRVRALNAGVQICAYGLYAPLNAEILRAHGVQTILGPEFEGRLLALADSFRLKAEATSGERSGEQAPVESRGFRLPPSREALRRTAVALAEAGQAEDQAVRIFATRFNATKKVSQTPRWLASVARPVRVSL
jgi:F420-0:gamma-glutamyl ligase